MESSKYSIDPKEARKQGKRECRTDGKNKI